MTLVVAAVVVALLVVVVVVSIIRGVRLADSPSLAIGLVGLLAFAVADEFVDPQSYSCVLSVGRLVCIVAFVYGCMELARDKGYSPLLGLLGLLFLVGLLIILLLPRRTRVAFPIRKRQTLATRHDSRYVYFGDLTEEQRTASYRVQDLLKERDGRSPQKSEVRPYVEALRAMSAAELRAIIDGQSGLPEC